MVYLSAGYECRTWVLGIPGRIGETGEGLPERKTLLHLAEEWSMSEYRPLMYSGVRLRDKPMRDHDMVRVACEAYNLRTGQMATVIEVNQESELEEFPGTEIRKRRDIPAHHCRVFTEIEDGRKPEESLRSL